jgi:hypothetical protein
MACCSILISLDQRKGGDNRAGKENEYHFYII